MTCASHGWGFLRISDECHFEEEKSHLLKVFENNGYCRPLGLKALKKYSLGLRHKKYLNKVTDSNKKNMKNNTKPKSRILE